MDTTARIIYIEGWAAPESEGGNTSPSAISAINGLNKSGDDIKLGGSLTQNTTINLEGNDFFISGGGRFIFSSTSTFNLNLVFRNKSEIEFENKDRGVIVPDSNPNINQKYRIFVLDGKLTLKKL
jgi:hypothetical protein